MVDGWCAPACPTANLEALTQWWLGCRLPLEGGWGLVGSVAAVGGMTFPRRASGPPTTTTPF